MNGNIYEGELIGGKLNGLGKITTVQGDLYKGFFINDKLNGLGTIAYANGDVQEGQFKDDHFKWPNGNQYIGECVDGLLNGKGRKFSLKASFMKVNLKMVN
jgi:hypothetical protein